MMWFCWGEDVRKSKKFCKKVKKVIKKVLTFLWESDRIYKSHGAPAQAALNLENDTDRNNANKETVIPNELSLAG